MILRLLLPLALLLTSCAQNRVTGQRELSFISEERELALGEESYSPMRQLNGGDLVLEPEINAYVSRVGHRIAEVSDRPELPWEFNVINNPTPNAWALPGGKVAIYRGLLTELDSEAELAAVLSHEIVHSAARHGAQNIERATLLQTALSGLEHSLGGLQQGDLLLGATNVGAQLLTAKYSRDKELEADRYGIDYMIRAGYNPEGAVTLQEKLLANSEKRSWLEGLLATHPPSEQRLEANRKRVEALSPEGRTGAELYSRTMTPLKQNAAAYAQYDAARASYNEGRLPDAERGVRRALKTESTESHFWGLLGSILSTKGDTTGAMDAFNQAIVLNDNYFDHFLQRAAVHEKLGDTQQMRADLESSEALLPTTQANYKLAMLDLNEGFEPQAIGHLRKAAEAQTDFGRLAHRKLTALELPKHPEKYLKVVPKLDQRGYLMLTMENNSVFPVRNVIIAMHTDDSPKQMFRFRGEIIPSDSRTLATRVGPYPSVAELTNAIRRLEVTELQVIE